MKQEKQTVIGMVLITYILLVFAIFWAGSGATAAQVLIGLSGFYIHSLLVVVRVFTKLDEHADLLFMWVTPIATSLLFFIVWASQSVGIISVMDGQSLAVWQVLLSYLLNILAVVFIGIALGGKKKGEKRSAPKPEPRQPVQQQPVEQPKPQVDQTHALNSQLTQQQHHIQQLQEQLAQSQQYQQMASEYMQHNAAYSQRVHELEDELRVTQQKLSINRDNVSVSLREIEAKAKALNFVVGRVYADKKGGSKDIRELLHIPRDLYNEFSQITSDYTSDDASRLLNILLILQNKLALYELPEKKMFALDVQPQKELDRDVHGNDPIIEVLSRNDSDPVVDYYAGAKEVCTRLVEFLQSERA